MNSLSAIRLLSGTVFLCVAVVGIIVMVLYILSLSKALQKCSPTSRTMQPGLVWLLIIPFFGLIWNFFVVLALAKSLGAEFHMRNIQGQEIEPGKTIGMAMAICQVCSMIPLLGVFAAIAGIVLWIMYWIKIVNYSNLLAQPVTISGAISN